MKISLYVENTAQANLRFAALSLALSRGERGLGCRLPLRFRQIFTSLKLHFQTTSWSTTGTRIDRLSQRFRPMAARTRVYAANSEAAVTRPLSPWERVRERAVSRKLTSKPITLPLQPRPLKAACNETKTTNRIKNHPTHRRTPCKTKPST